MNSSQHLELETIEPASFRTGANAPCIFYLLPRSLPSRSTELEFISFSLSKCRTRARWLGLSDEKRFLSMPMSSGLVPKGSSPRSVLVGHTNTPAPTDTLNTAHFNFYTSHLFVSALATVCDHDERTLSFAQGRESFHEALVSMQVVRKSFVQLCCASFCSCDPRCAVGYIGLARSDEISTASKHSKRDRHPLRRRRLH